MFNFPNHFSFFLHIDIIKGLIFVYGFIHILSLMRVKFLLLSIKNAFGKLRLICNEKRNFS